MIFTEGMRKVEILLLKRDIDVVLEYLGVNRCVQVTDMVEREKSEEYHTYQTLLQQLKGGMEFLRVPGPGANLPAERIRRPTSEDVQTTKKILEKISELLQREKTSREQLLQVESTLQEVRVFQKMNFPLGELEHVTYLVYRYGVLAPEKIGELEKNLAGRALLFRLDPPEKIFAIAAKKGRFALDTELKNVDFRELPLPEMAKDWTPSLLQELEKNAKRLREELEAIEKSKEEWNKAYGGTLVSLHSMLEVGYAIEELKAHLEQTEHAYRLRGWIPKSLVSKTLKELENITEGRIAIRIYRPEELESVREGREKIPVRLKQNRFVQSFDGIVFAYGAPLYGTIDPTPIVAFFFTFLFAIMFGDLGQGLIIFLFGVVLRRELVPSLKKWKKYALVFKTVGAASMVTGFLYGSCFASETLLVPVLRPLTKLLWGEPRDRFISLMPTEGTDRMLQFFGFTLAVGVVLNSLGLIINILNRLRLKDLHRGIFSKTGLVGALFFWYSLSVGVRLLSGNRRLLPIDAPILVALLLLIFWGEPLARVLEGKRPVFPEGFFSFVIEGIVEVLESVSYYVSNSVSFLRVGAFALSHAVLSLIVFQIADLLRSLPAGILFQALMIAGGNLLILLLEGLIVTIQVIRLHYYEFFSKFFTESGVPFKPFDLTKA